MSSKDANVPSEADLAKMNRDQLLELGGDLDGVKIVDYPDPWPVKGTRAEKRAERLIALWFAIAGLAGLAFVVLLCWPEVWKYRAPGSAGTFWYDLYTPALGVTLGLAVLGIGVGVLLYTKKFIPNELTIQ